MAVYQFPFDNPNVGDGFGSMASFRTNPHRGLDFAQPVGTPIGAVADGVISGIYFTNVLGNVTEVYHQEDGKYSGYCHSDQSTPLFEGQRVVRGQIINEVGNTGFTTGAHLHLTIGDDRGGAISGHVQDPYEYIRARLNGTPVGPPGPNDPPRDPALPPLPPVDVPRGSERWTENFAVRPSATVKAASGKIRITVAGTGSGALMTYSIPGVRERDEAIVGFGRRAGQLVFPASNAHVLSSARSWVQEVPKDEDVTVTAETFGLDPNAVLVNPSIVVEVVY